MTDMILERIKQVRSGHIPQGYTRTKAGIMPKDWNQTVQAKQLFKSHTNKRHNGDLEILAATQENGMIPRSQIGKEIKSSEEGIAGYKIVAKGDFVISLRSFQGGIEFSEYDGIVSPAYTVLKAKAMLCSGYYKYYFKTSDFISRLNSAVYGIRDGKQIGFEDFGDLYLHCPPVKEQQKIAEILSQCDKIIDLYQAELEEVKHLKRACLQMMFPKTGESYPKCRFPGFTAAWKQRKLIDICSVFTDGDWIESKDQSDQGVRLIQTGNVGVTEYLDKPDSKKWVSDETFKRLHCTEVLSGDILISRLPEPAGRACIVPDLRQKMITAVDCTIARIAPEYCSEYVIQYLSTQEYFDEVNNCLAGGTRQRISRRNLSGLLIPLPCSKAEQERIGGFFHSLDDLIALHQSKLNAMQLKKKALMQLLLTGIVRVNT